MAITTNSVSVVLRLMIGHRALTLNELYDRLTQACDEIDLQHRAIDKFKAELALQAECYYKLEKERDRLQAIIDAHDLCHNQHGKVDAQAFADGCRDEQRKIYGCSPDADALAEIQRIMSFANPVNLPDFMYWLAERLVNAYKEPSNCDFIQALKSRAGLIRMWMKSHPPRSAPTTEEKLEFANRRIKELEIQLANEHAGNMDGVISYKSECDE